MNICWCNLKCFRFLPNHGCCEEKNRLRVFYSFAVRVMSCEVTWHWHVYSRVTGHRLSCGPRPMVSVVLICCWCRRRPRDSDPQKMMKKNQEKNYYQECPDSRQRQRDETGFLNDLTDIFNSEIIVKADFVHQSTINRWADVMISSTPTPAS